MLCYIGSWSPKSISTYLLRLYLDISYKGSVELKLLLFCSGVLLVNILFYFQVSAVFALNIFALL